MSPSRLNLQDGIRAGARGPLATYNAKYAFSQSVVCVFPVTLV